MPATKRILVIDDSTAVVKLIESTLMSAGHSVLTASDGEEGLEAERVRTILLQVLRGGQSWMKQNQAKMGFSTLPYTTGLLIEELEKWRT